MAKINEKVRSWCRILGDIIDVGQGFITVETKALDANGEVRLDKNNELCIDQHPVIVPDAEILAKFKTGKRIGFYGWLKREGNRTMLFMDTKRLHYVQNKLPSGYVNQAGLAGLVVFNRLLNDDPTKQAQLTVGIGQDNTTGTAIWCVLWQSIAIAWAQALQGSRAEAQIVGRMRSREIPGGMVMYELVGQVGSKLVTEPIETGFESFDESAMEAAMAFKTDLPPEATGTADPKPQVEASGEFSDDNIPF